MPNVAFTGFCGRCHRMGQPIVALEGGMHVCGPCWNALLAELEQEGELIQTMLEARKLQALDAFTKAMREGR